MSEPVPVRPPSLTLPCVGGPLHGQYASPASQDGFLAVDKAEGRAWVYVRDGDRWSVVTDHDGSLIYPDGPASGERTLDWDRLPAEGEGPAVVTVTDVEENYAGPLVSDGWDEGLA